MTMFTKPHDVRYTDMCIWIDDNAYSENCDEAKLYEYIYHIVNMLQHKRQFFKHNCYHEDFAIYASNIIFMRYRNPSSREKDNKIRSVLNYTKKRLYPMKVDFEKENYLENDSMGIDIDKTFQFSNALRDEIDSFNLSDFKSCLNDVTSICQEFIQTDPHYKCKETRNQFYNSCMLTFLSRITPSTRDLQKCGDLDLYKLREKYRDETILLHLDKSMKDYIYVFVNRMEHYVANGLSQVLHSYVPTEQMFKSMYVKYDEETGDDCYES